MPHVAVNSSQYLAQVVGNGHCVALVQACSAVGHTSGWRQGVPARGGEHPSGTIIATFDPDGRYGNNTDGSSHVAILISEVGDGLMVQDQWQGQPAHHRVIRFRDGQGDAVNDGDRFHLVETVTIS
jgi:hypothetical protein